MKKLLMMVAAGLIGSPLFGAQSDGLVAHYKFDNNLNDASGNGYALSGESVAYGVDRNQGSSAALSCSGATELRPSKTLEVDETFTVACWVKAGKDTAVYSEDGRMYRTCYDEGNVVLAPGFSQKYPDDGAGVGFSVGKNGIAVYEHAGVYLPVVLMYEANIGDGWNHVVVQVENNGAPKVYLNGALVRTGVQGAKSKRSVVIMADGAHALCGGGYGHFSGSMDDLRIYNRVLAATEIKSLYEGGSGTQSGGGLVHRWSFNGNLEDSVGGQTAKIVGNVATDGGQYTLTGGSRGSSYIDLGSHILPRNGSGVTIELWATQRSEKFWGRIWDIGNSTSDEMFMAWTDQCNVNKDGFQVRGVTSSDVSAFAPYVLGTEYHISTVFEPQGDGSWKIRFYKKNTATGVTIKSYELDSKGKSWTLQNQGQNCCWLGHSIFTQDDDANASYNEVRVWKRALTEVELTANALLGPNVLPGGSPEPGPPTYTITFDANGGTPTPTAITRKGGEVYGTLPTVTKSGFTFDGWYTSASGGMKVTSENTATGNVTLYAHWVQNAIYYTVTFNVNGGSCSTSSKQYESGAMLGALPTAKRSGYTFDGWYTAANGGTRVGGSTIVTENIVLYAHWRVPPASNVKMISLRQRYPWNGLVDVDCEVSIGEDSGYKVGLEVVDDEAGTNLAVKTLWVVGGEETNKYVSVRSGAQRLVWNADADLPDGFKCKMGRARLRLAKQVEFDAAGGQCDVGSKTFILGEPYGALPIPTRSGYQFVGWCAAAYDGARIDAESIADPVISVLTAKWEVR